MAPTSPKTPPNTAAGEDTTVAERLRVNIVYRPSTWSPPTEDVELPMKILVMGDHTGREDPRPLAERATVPLDKERFDAAMAAQALRLELTVPDHLDPVATGAREVALRFERLADFTPERVARQVPEMRRLLELRSALSALKGPLGAVPAFRKKLSVLHHSREGRARLAREVGVELAGSVGWLGLPRLRWGPYDVFAVIEEHVEGERSVFVARLEMRFGIHDSRAFELARSEHPIAFVRVDTESMSWLVAHLEVRDGALTYPVTLVADRDGRIPCAFLASVRVGAQVVGDAIAAVLQFRLNAHPYHAMVPVYVDLARGSVRASPSLTETHGPPRAPEGWIRLGGGARLLTVPDSEVRAETAVAPRLDEASDHTDAAGLQRWVRDRIDALATDEVRHVGVVCVDAERRVSLVSRAAGETFAAVERRGGERASVALTRCLVELGATVSEVFPLRGSWRVKAAPALYFIARCVGWTPTETAALHTPDEAAQRLAEARDDEARVRDLGLLALVRATPICAARRVLLAVRELHAMGFEGIRPVCEMSRSGMHWRVHLDIPKARAVALRGALPRREPPLDTSYSTAEGQRIFGVDDTCFESPVELALRLLRDAPGLVHRAHTRDTPYARWYADALATTAPDGLFIDHDERDGAFAFADVAAPAPDLSPPPAPTERAPEVQVPLTPREDGLWFGRLDDARLVGASGWCVRIRATGGPPEPFVAAARVAKIASWSGITDAVYRPDPVPMRLRSSRADEAWFDVDHPTRWPAVMVEKTVAIYLPPPWTPARVAVELWASLTP